MPERYQPGDVIATKYRITSLIGEGGMGAVWLARNLTLHIDVALKLIRRDVANAQTADRLLQEARAAARLRHPSIVRVHDFGETEYQDPFIVMELLNGDSFGAVLDRKGSLTAARAVQMLLPILSALSDAHAAGIVHRDLKPENIILVAERSGTILPKLVDFGIAKMKRGAVITGDFPASPDSKAARQLARKLTQLGSLVGSPDYMSPEQARGDADLDERADLWSISVVLYEAIAGQRPFEGQTVEDLLLAVLIQDPTPTTVFGAGDEKLWQIIERGLQRDRKTRWQSAREMGKALARWLRAQGIDSDIAGTSLEQHWLKEGGPLRLSGFPSADGDGLVERDPLGVNETPAKLERPDYEGITKPDKGAARWLGAVVAAAVALLIAVVVVALRSGASESAESASASSAAAAPSVESAAPGGSAVAQSEPAEPAERAEPAASAEATTVPSAAPPPAHVAPPFTRKRPVARPKKPSSSGGTPIPDVPNF